MGLDTRVPAVVVGFSLNGLGVVRSLANTGIPCWVLYNDPNDPGLATRYGRKVRVPNIDAAGIIPALHAICRESGERPVLYLTNDMTVASLSACRAEWQGVARLKLPPDSIVQSLLNKENCRSLYDQAGIRQPRSIKVTHETNVADLAGLSFPCIIKPGKKPDGYAERFKKAYMVRNPAEVIDVFNELEYFVPDMIAQEWIEGDDTEIYFCFAVVNDYGDIITSFVGQKLLSYPQKIGNTACCFPAANTESELVNICQQFFKSIGFSGLGSLEFKRHKISQEFFVIEPTVFRVDYQLEIATLNGVNIPLAYYCFETDQVTPTIRARKPAGWQDPVYMSLLRRDGIRPSFSERQPRPRLVDAYFRWRDPGPWLMLKCSWVKQAVRRVRRELARLTLA